MSNLESEAPGLLRVRENETLRTKTLKVLREAVLSGHFQPGHRLVERDLCEQTGVSRSSVREALRHLESEGLVESRGTRGMFVASLTIAAAMEIYEVRVALESEAARHFTARATATELRRIERTYASMANAGGRDADAYRKQTDLFFDELFAGAHNATAEGIMQSLRARISFVRATTTRLSPPARRKGSIAQMGEIVEALKARDGERAADACRRFIARSAGFAAECLEAGEPASKQVA